MEVERLINRHKDAVYRQMLRTCGNHEDAEDALADALLAALKASEQLNDPASFKSWLARIGTRACWRTRVRERLVHFTSLEELEANGLTFPVRPNGPDKIVEMALLKDCVRGAIESLHETYREVYIRRDVNGDTAKDVAVSLNLSIAAVKSRLHRARRMMRDALDSGLGCPSLGEGA